MYRSVPLKHVVPIRRYFLVIGPCLAAIIWFVGSYMEPNPPVQAQSATSTQAAKPGTIAPAQAARPAPVTPVQAAKQAVPVPVEPTANPPTTEQEAPPPNLVIDEPAALETTGSAEPTPAPVQTAQKHKKRKQVAQRQQRRNIYASAERRPYYDTPYYNPTYAGFRPLVYGQR
jgi:hypothetical protein